MTGNVNVTIKIDPALKDILKSIARENQTSLSQEVCKRLEQRLQATAQTVDSQRVADETEQAPLSAAELKKVRRLIKKNKKK